jgi:MSHA pilin protein MshC
MAQVHRGFTLIELIAVMVVVGVMSVVLFSRIGNVSHSNVQASRDDLIAALFFAQQSAMARSGIQLIVIANSVSVEENGVPIIVHSQGYPLAFQQGVSATPAVFFYNKLGGTTAGAITLSGNGASASVTVEASGYAH